MARVLVTDGQERAALAVVRSLGRAGHQVFVCSPRRHSLAGVSRYARAEAQTPDPLAGPLAFVATVQRLSDAWGIDVLLPISDAALLALLPARERFPHVRIPFPTADVFRGLADKAAVLARAGALRIATPEQHVLACPAARTGLASAQLRFPVVVKPARSVAESDGRRVKVGVRHATDPLTLAAALERFPPDAYPLLLQERVDGPGVGVFLLCWEGEALAVFAHQRLREKPPTGGVSVYRASIAADPDLVARSRTLLEAFGWQGVAMVEYKLDRATRVPYLMEVNPRFWGSLQLAVDAGVDFPALLVAAALGERPRPVPEYRIGVCSRWEWGEVDHLLARLRHPSQARGRWQAVREFVASWGNGGRNEICRASDPYPFIWESLQWCRRKS
jgi:predicted ATP-grasp superfamily ATP-dependent carboligase